MYTTRTKTNRKKKKKKEKKTKKGKLYVGTEKKTKNFFVLE